MLVGKRFPNWRDLNHEQLASSFAWPLEGLWFDAKQNSLWLPEVRVMSSARGEGRFIRQAGPPGHVGHMVMLVDRVACDGLTFEWAVPESAIPERFSQAVLRGIERTCSKDGPFAGCTFTQTRVRIIDGSYHEVDSRERSYEMASAFSFEDAIQRAGGVIDVAQ